MKPLDEWLAGALTACLIRPARALYEWLRWWWRRTGPAQERSDAELRDASGRVQMTPAERIAGGCLALVLGICGAAALLHWAISCNVVPA